MGEELKNIRRSRRENSRVKRSFAVDDEFPMQETKEMRVTEVFKMFLNVPWRFACVPLEQLLLPFLFFFTSALFTVGQLFLSIIFSRALA